jgi:hypothetical protein
LLKVYINDNHIIYYYLYHSNVLVLQMNKIFKSKPKSPQEIVRLIKEALINLEKGDSVKAKEKVII